MLFLDEPTIGVDISTRHRVYEFIKKINEKEKVTIIITSHDIYDIEMLAERIILIDKGKILFEGKKEEFIKKFGSRKKKIFIEMKELFEKEKINAFLKMKDIKFRELENGRIFLEIDEDKGIIDLLKEIEKYSSIRDLHVEGESLREVIKRIYENKK